MAVPPPFDVFVELLPGEEAVEDFGFSLVQQKGRRAMAATTKVSVSITEKKGNGFEEIPVIKGCLKNLNETGVLEKTMEQAITNVTGTPADVEVHGFDVKKVAQWAKGFCEPHVDRIVKRFTVAYTRRMVPF